MSPTQIETANTIINRLRQSHLVCKSYAGIGSRETPDEVLEVQTQVATLLMLNGYRLNSGGAPGSDTAFEDGCGDICDIFIPWNGFEKRRANFHIPRLAFELANCVHPVFERLTYGMKAMMGRNAQQVFGPELIDWVEFVLCWTKDGCESHVTRTGKTGGTGQAIAYASLAGIPVINMYNDNWLERLEALQVFSEVGLDPQVRTKWLNLTRSKLSKSKKR